MIRRINGLNGVYISNIQYDDVCSNDVANLFVYFKAPITSLTWGHNDRRLFVATGNVIHVAWVSRRIPSLQHLSRQRVRHSLTKKSLLDAIEMPCLMRNLLLPMFASTVHVSVHQLLIYLALSLHSSLPLSLPLSLSLPLYLSSSFSPPLPFPLYGIFMFPSS